ncbi:hypothetical protein [Paractinoplanes brasiliensis]|uniref:hypothetical protein n=1 Tax=Paractinoplanes brasiliensis TaxID=52695 RepID=UPI00105B2E4B|nr:hypothetical protein [Actinoplanes brasiliensis]
MPDAEVGERILVPDLQHPADLQPAAGRHGQRGKVTQRRALRGGRQRGQHACCVVERGLLVLRSEQGHRPATGQEPRTERSLRQFTSRDFAAGAGEGGSGHLDAARISGQLPRQEGHDPRADQRSEVCQYLHGADEKVGVRGRSSLHLRERLADGFDDPQRVVLVVERIFEHHVVGIAERPLQLPVVRGELPR